MARVANTGISSIIDLNGNETTLRDLFINNPDLSHVMYDGDHTKPGIRKDDGADGEIYPTENYQSIEFSKWGSETL